MTLTAQVIPIQPVVSQTLNVTLSGQVCTINIYEKDIWIPTSPPGSIITDPPLYVEILPIFIDLYVNDALLIGGVLARNGIGIVQNSYFGFNGEIAIEDTEGNTDPFVAGLGSRFALTYWYDAP